MTTEQFIEAINNPNRLKLTKILADKEMREPQIYLEMRMPEEALCSSVHIMGFTKVRAGVWYLKEKSGNVLPGGAFKLYPEGTRTFAAWAKTVPSQEWAKKIEQDFVTTFEGAVDPDFVDN